MFKLDLSDSYEWPVDVAVPDHGRAKKLRFDASFVRLSQPEIDALMKCAGSGEIEDIEFCNRILVGWRGIKDADNNDFEYSEANKDILLKVFPVAASIVQAYGNSLDIGLRKN